MNYTKANHPKKWQVEFDEDISDYFQPSRWTPEQSLKILNLNSQLNLNLFRDAMSFHSVSRVKNAAVLTLNRPKALNAINKEMSVGIRNDFKKTIADKPSVIISKSSFEKAFCAGGDIRALTDLINEKKFDEVLQASVDEWNLYYTFATSPIPVVSLMHGIVMGGGAGLCMHSKYRVGTETTTFAMPETAIGFFPDAGASHFLPRLPQKNLGKCLAVSGMRMKGINCFDTGITSHFCHSTLLGKLEEDLTHCKNESDILQVLDDVHKQSLKLQINYDKFKYHDQNPERWNNGGETIYEVLREIEEHYSAQNFEDLKEALRAGSKWAVKHLETVEKMSPTACMVALETGSRGSHMDLKQVFQMEYWM